MSEYVQLAEFNDRVVDPVEVAVLTAVYNSMLIVYKGMRTIGLVQPEETDEPASVQKSDGSLFTRWDKDSEEKASEVLAELAPQVLFEGEEGTRSGSGESGIIVRYDPNDGTRTFVTGGTDATVIATAYNPDNTIYGAAIGQPSTGRLYSAFGDRPTEGRLLTLLDKQRAATELYVPHITTWQGDLSQKGQVFIDNNRPHPRNSHVTLTAGQHIQIRARLLDHDLGILERGTNGGQQLAVASGRDRAAAALTTVRGIWVDTSAGVHLVERSGGAVQRYNAVEGVITPVGAEILDYDMALVANNEATLTFLNKLLLGVSIDPAVLKL